MELYPYIASWADNDRHANFKAEVAHYTLADPMPTLEVLSESTGIPVPCLVRYVLVKYVASGADVLLAMGPIVLRQLEDHIQKYGILSCSRSKPMTLAELHKEYEVHHECRGIPDQS